MAKAKGTKSSVVPEDSDSFWSEGAFFETMDSTEMKEKMKTFHESPNDEKNFNCEQRNAKISAHNRDWHAGMRDDCFYKKHFPDTVRK